MVLEGKSVLVSGGGRGIGGAIALAAAGAGANVAVADVDAGNSGEVAAAVRSLGRDGLALTTDVTDPSQVQAMVADTLEAFGAVDVFFNNAGIIEVQDFFSTTVEDWHRTMNVNALGVFLCAQAVAQVMLDAGRGKIINTASIAAWSAVPDSVPYGMSKAAVVSLTRSLAAKFAGKGVTVNAIAPGMVDTDMWSLIDEQTANLRGMELGEPRRRRERRIPMGRAATPEDIAKVALFLASDSSDYMTGQTLNIDGGSVMP